MKNEDKTKEQLINELIDMRQQIAELEKSDTQHDWAEKRVIRQNVVLDAINKVFRETLACESDEEVASTCLAVAEELTGSKFGWIGEVNQAGRLDTIALSNPGWEACRIPESGSALMIKDMEIRGIWGRVLKDEQSQIVNNPASHPDRVGTPEGHPTLTSFLGVPLKHAGRTIGMIALANKESGYDIIDQQDIETLTIAFVEALNRKRSENALQESEERFRLTFENAKDTIFWADPKTGLITNCNKAAETLLEKKREEIIGYHQTTLHPLQKAEFYDKMFKKHIQQKGVVDDEAEIITKSGKIKPVHITASLTLIGGKPIIQGIFRDITERKQAEETIKHGYTEFNQIFNTAVDGIMVSNPKGYIVKVNEAVEKMLGYTQKELIGKHVAELSCKEEKCLEIATDVMTRLHEKGFVESVETAWLRKDGSLCPIGFNVALLKDKEGNTTGAVASIRDITNRKKVEKSIEQRNRELSAINTIATAAMQSNDLESTLTESLKVILEIIDFHIGAIYILDEKNERMVLKSYHGFNPDHIPWGKLVEIKALTSYEDSPWLTGETQVLEDASHHPILGQLVKKEGLKGLASIPIKSKNKFIGIINTAGRETHFFSPEEVKTLDTLAVQIGLSIENAILFKQNKEVKEIYQTLVDNVHDIIFTVNTKGNFSFISAQIQSILGYAPEELIGSSFMDTVHPDNVANNIESFEYLFRGKKIKDLEYRVRHKNGSWRWHTSLISALKDRNGNIISLLGVARDITERKSAEETLKRSEKKYQSLIENAIDAIVSVNEDSKIVSFNKKAEEIFGYSREEILGKSINVLTHTIERERQRKLLEKLKKTNKLDINGKPLEGKVLRKDGQEIPVETSTFTIKIQGGYLITSFTRDISERKNMEHKILQSEKLKSLGELAGGVAHDFNNVLAAILGRAQLLKMIAETPPGKQERRRLMHDLKKGLQIIENAALDGAETVRRIQEFSRRRADDKDFTQVDVNKLIDDTLELTRVRWKNDAESKGIKIRIQKKFSPLPPIAGSASELREVFTNLINNALDAMPQGGQIKIKTFEDDSHISIIIEDTGIGIPKAIKDRIFDPFFTTKGPQSTGLGMSVSYGIINRHRGTIKVNSVVGQGTTFTIKLPKLEKTVEEEKVKSLPKKKRKARILVIEDEKDVRQLLSDILITAGHKVETASDGRKGVEMHNKKDFDLVFTDLGMTGMSGWQVAEKIKSINGRVPVALITGWELKLEESKMRESGVDFVISKPFKVGQVLRLVQEGMQLRDRFKAV